MVDAERIQISDIAGKNDGTNITISGMVIDKYKSSKDKLIVTVKDLSGTIKVCVQLSEALNQSFFWKQTILQLTGVITTMGNGEQRIENVTNVSIFSTSKKNKICLSVLDVDISKKASTILMSNICRRISNLLIEEGFIEFESRVLSYNWPMDGLETLSVFYPGFGSPATLITSPSPQITDFLKTTMMSRAFTESISFATTFRFIDGGAETRVIMAKALDLSEEELIRIIYSIACNILRQFGESYFTYPSLENDIQRDQWPKYNVDGIKNTINMIAFQSDLEICTDDYASKIEEIIHIIDIDKNILTEGAREVLPNGLVISTITVYPVQFLSLLKKAPARQLQELWRKHDW